MTPTKEGGVNVEEEQAARELRNLDDVSVKLAAEAKKLDAEAKKLEGRKIERTAYTDAVKLALAAFASILAALQVANALGWL